MKSTFNIRIKFISLSDLKKLLLQAKNLTWRPFWGTDGDTCDYSYYLATLLKSRFFDEALYITMRRETCFMGYFEANPTFLEPEGDLVFGLYDIDMEAAAPHLEAAMRVFPALAR